MADNLETFFKKHLIDETSGEENWNVPSDDVWDNVLPEIQKENGFFISWKNLILIAAGITLAALLILFLLWNGSTNSNLSVDEIESPTQVSANNNMQQNEINKKENYTQTLEEEGNAEESNINENVNNPDQESIINESTTNTFLKDNTNKSSKDIKTKKDINSSNNIVSTENKEVYTEVDESAKDKITEEKQNIINNQKVPTEKPVVEKKISTPIFTKENNVDEADVIQSDDIAKTNNAIADSSFINKEKTPLLEDIAEDDETTQINFNGKGKIGIGAFFTPTITSTYLTGEMVNGIENSSPMYLYSSNYGLELKYHLSNKFAIILGIGKSEIKSWSKSNVDFNYNTSSEEIMPSGDKSNTSDIPMPTPFGDVATSVTYHFPGSANLPDGEVMQSVMETHQRIQYLSIPIGVEYNLIRHNRINWTVEGGFRFNKSVIDGSRFTSRILHNGEDMEVVGEQQTGDPDFKDIYFNYYIGTGINYRLKKYLQINTSIRYLGNIDDVNLQNNMSTNVHEFNLKVGIMYLF